MRRKEPTEQHPRNAAETRKRILDAARTLFSRDVYRNVGTRDIAAAAGVNLTLINRYFGSKKQLFNEVALSMGPTMLSPDAAREVAREAITDLLADGENPRKEKLRLLLRSAMDSEVSDVVAEFFQRQRKRRADLMQGGDRETKAFLALSSLVGIALNYFFLSPEDRAQLDKDAIIDHFVASFDAMHAKDAVGAGGEMSKNGEMSKDDENTPGPR